MLSGESKSDLPEICAKVLTSLEYMTAGKKPSTMRTSSLVSELDRQTL